MSFSVGYIKIFLFYITFPRRGFVGGEVMAMTDVDDMRLSRLSFSSVFGQDFLLFELLLEWM